MGSFCCFLPSSTRCYIVIKFCYLCISLLIADLSYLLYSHLILLQIALSTIIILELKATYLLFVFILHCTFGKRERS